MTLGEMVEWACVHEASAPKPGNVGPHHDFDDLKYADMLKAAAAIRPVFDKPKLSVGETILEAVQATRQAVQSNANLGIVLLLAPLSRVSMLQPLAAGIRQVLDQLTVNDARLTYQAIRLAQPSGLGRVPHQDITDEPAMTLKDVMALAADRDTIARQYVNGFEQVFEAADLLEGYQEPNAIVRAYLQMLSRYPDSLICRKHGLDAAKRVSQMAAEALACGDDAIRQMHEQLIAPPKRNPGTTADLIAAGLFVVTMRC